MNRDPFSVDCVELLKALAIDLSIDNDTVEYCIKRYKKEGFPFLSVTLPSFSKKVIYCVSVGRINDPTDEDTMITSFALGGWSRVPRVFRVQLSALFNRKGLIKGDCSPEALKNLRQFCEYFYKLATNLNDKERKEAEVDFCFKDAAVGAGVDWLWVDSLRKRLETYYHLNEPVSTILRQYPPRITPGTFFRSGLVSKTSRHPADFKRSLQALRCIPDTFRSYVGFAKPYPRVKLTRWLDKHPPIFTRARTCEVLMVPKDSRGPRVICREPHDSIRYQMSYFDYMTRKLERVTGGRIRFYDQTLHRELAREGSESGKWSTMDLKDASDLVPFSVVEALFKHLPVRKFFDLRSQVAWFPDHNNPGNLAGRGYWTLNKLAGMGSGLTFPTMSLLIHLTVSEAIYRYHRASNNLLALRSFRSCMRDVYTYGDDLIVPSAYSHLVETALAKVGLKLNKAKSFTTGSFRESCGGDFLRGTDVTPVRLKLSGAGIPHKSRLRRTIHFVQNYRGSSNWDIGVLQVERHCRELVKAGMHSTVQVFYRELERHLGRLPIVSGEAPALGRYTTNPRDVETAVLRPQYAWHFVPKSIPYQDSDGRDDYVDNTYRLGELLARPNGVSELSMLGQELGLPNLGNLSKRLVTYPDLLGSQKSAVLYGTGGLRVDLRKVE